MAIYHLEAQIIGRTDGRSAIACAAYRSGEAITDERTGAVNEHGAPARVAHTEIIAPVGAPDWTTDRSQLWNRVEVGEKRVNSQLSREFEIALPNELTLDEQRVLLRGWVQAELTPHGVIADIAIHIEPRKNRAARRSDHAKAKKARNDHAHIMTTMRALADDGEGFGEKLRNLNWNGTIERWRASWQEHVNAALERAGREERVDHRSHADRGIEDEPTKKEGPAARGMEARGQESERMAENRAIRARNAKRFRARMAENRRKLDEIKAQVRASRPSKERVAERIIATGAKGPRNRPAEARAFEQGANVNRLRNARPASGQAKPAPGPRPNSHPEQTVEVDDAILAEALRKRNETAR